MLASLSLTDHSLIHSPSKVLLPLCIYRLGLSDLGALVLIYYFLFNWFIRSSKLLRMYRSRSNINIPCCKNQVKCQVKDQAWTLIKDQHMFPVNPSQALSNPSNPAKPLARLPVITSFSKKTPSNPPTLPHNNRHSPLNFNPVAAVQSPTVWLENRTMQCRRWPMERMNWQLLRQ